MDGNCLYVVAGGITGLAVGLTGVGGGALMTPLLLLLFGIAPTTAVATDLWFAAATKVVAVSVHRRHATIDWLVVRRLWLGSIPLALVSVWIAGHVQPASKSAWLSHLIGVMVCIAALGMLAGPRIVRALAAQRPPSTVARPWQAPLTMAAGAALGAAVAFTSVGAGTLGSVMLMALYPLRLTVHRLVMADLVHAIPLSLVAGLAYGAHGLVDWPLLGMLLLGSVPGAIAGGLLAGRLPPRPLQVALAAALLLAGGKAAFG